ncbi:hypothetical protein ACQJ75_02220 [Helicobacter pylori]
MRTKGKRKQKTNKRDAKSFNELKEITQAIQEQKERTLTLARKTALNRLQKSLKRAFWSQ